LPSHEEFAIRSPHEVFNIDSEFRIGGPRENDAPLYMREVKGEIWVSWKLAFGI
jgi:hypothetical protein